MAVNPVSYGEAALSIAPMFNNSPPPTLDGLSLIAAADMAAVDAIIIKNMSSPVPLVQELAAYIVQSGGKRLRPLLTVAAARLCGYSGGRHVCLAAAVEFIHTATLLHDDVVDESQMRRGLTSANAVFGSKASVLVGDFLFSRAFQLMVEDGSLDVLHTLATASATIAEGEVLQLTTTNDTETDEETCMRVVKSKTAALFAASCQIGAIIAKRPTTEQNALEQFGLNLGLAFQIVDDVLDYSAHQALLGKTVGDDFREGKLTLPIVIAISRGSPAEKNFWRRVLERLEQKEGDLAEAQALMHRHGAMAEAMARARGFAQAAKASLAPFGNSPEKRALLEAAEFTVAREY